MAEDFELLKVVNDIHVQLSNAHGHKYRVFKIEDTEIWVQYFNDGINDTHTYQIEGSKNLGGIPSIMVVKKVKDKEFKVYKFNGTIQINRKIERGISFDFIENILDIENRIKENLLN